MHVWLTFVCLLFPLTHTADDTPSEREILDRLLDPAVYDASIRPGAGKGESTKVELDIDVKSLGPVNDIDMEFSVSIFLRQEWLDERLKYDDLNTSITIGYKRLASLWVPDLFFPKSRVEIAHDVTTPNVMFVLASNGRILYSQRLSLTVRCRMDLSNFPMDTQTCGIDMESFSYSNDLMYFTWSTGRNATYLQPGAKIPDFTIIGISTDDCTIIYSTGTFSCLRAAIYLKREIGFYAIQTYIPSILIVVISWASFWIDHEAIPARISVGLLTVLTITTQSSGVLSQLPRVPYIKAIDVWMSSCLLFVFAAYMENAVVTVLSRRYKKKLERRRKNISKSSAYGWRNVRELNSRDNNNTPITDDTNTTTDAGRYVDKLSRVGFPATFIIFNLIYWLYYKFI